MKTQLLIILIYTVISSAIWIPLLYRNDEPSIEKIDYTISISNGVVTVRNVDNNEVIGRNVLDSLSIIIINDNK